MSLKGKTIAVGVSGGIAAYKTCYVVSTLKKLGANVFVVMTKNAREFVSPLTFETLSGNRVITDTFERNFEHEVGHVSLSKKADLFVIVPATANIIGKTACGIADDFLSTTLMAAECPIVVAPAMNTAMLNSAAYRANEKILKERGVIFIPSNSGLLACGDIGDGRMAEPEQIVDFLVNILNKKQDYKDKTVLITAGATSEPIDPVRFITNRSSGKMGIELAHAVKARGAKVILIAGEIKDNFDLGGIEVIRAGTTQQMHDEVIKNFERADILIKAAAPSDYKVKDKSNQKIKSEKLILEFVKNPDIVAEAGKIKKNKKLIIFAAETENLIENAKKKLISKNADMVVANDVTKAGAGFDVDTNVATIITDNSVLELPIMTKKELSDKILDRILELKV